MADSIMGMVVMVDMEGGHVDIKKLMSMSSLKTTVSPMLRLIKKILRNNEISNILLFIYRKINWG